ncbi:MAG TPA: amidase family protein, partial [Pirellulaceae bacterium]|nr:amidase family protein [Pirellulaceae bacterium]
MNQGLDDMEELTRLTLQTAAAQLRAGRLTSRDLVEHCLARIDQLEDRLRAWVLVDREGARAAASRLDAELAAGRDRGPLHGLPIGIKDLFDIKDWPTRAAASFRESHV